MTPAQAISDEMSLYGLVAARDKGTPIHGRLFETISTRLGLDSDHRRHKPINTADMVRDSAGTLIAVRPRPAPNRPNIEAVALFLAQYSDGVTLKEAAAHFGVSETTIRRVVDDINPEFIYRGVPERCVRWRDPNKRPFVWSVTADRDIIDVCFQKHGTMGRELDTEFTLSAPPHNLILGHTVVLRW